MNEDLIEIQHGTTKVSKIRKFYEQNKILIFTGIIIFVVIFGSISFYLDVKKEKRILLTDSYIKAKIYIQNNQKDKAKKILKEIISANDSTYSTLSFFLILNENLIENQKELSNLFDYMLKNNKFQKEVKNLIIYKKALFKSNFVNEIELLEILGPLINAETLWKPHALLLLGDFFVSRNEYLKAKEFYLKILSLKNLNKALYERAKSQLLLINND